MILTNKCFIAKSQLSYVFYTFYLDCYDCHSYNKRVKPWFTLTLQLIILHVIVDKNLTNKIMVVKLSVSFFKILVETLSNFQ